MERICNQGHVIDLGKELCSRCNGAAVIKEAEVITPKIVAEPKKVRKPKPKPKK